MNHQLLKNYLFLQLRMEIGKIMPKDINPIQCVELFMSDESKSNNEMV